MMKQQQQVKLTKKASFSLSCSLLSGFIYFHRLFFNRFPNNNSNSSSCNNNRKCSRTDHQMTNCYAMRNSSSNNYIQVSNGLNMNDKYFSLFQDRNVGDEGNSVYFETLRFSILCFITLFERMTKTFSIHRNRRGERLRDPKSFTWTTRPRPAQRRRHAAWQSLPRQHRRSLRSKNGWKTFG